MMTTREKFVKQFGEEDTSRIEEAANTHRTKDRDNVWHRIGSMLAGEQLTVAPDQFLLDLSTCISWECLSRFRDDHGIAAGEEEIRQWCKNNIIIPDDYRDPICSRYDDYQVKTEIVINA